MPPGIHGDFKLVRTVHAENHRHAGNHGGDVLGGSLRRIAVEIVQHGHSTLIRPYAIRGDIGQLAECGQQFSRRDPGDQRRPFGLIAKQAGQLILESHGRVELRSVIGNIDGLHVDAVVRIGCGNATRSICVTGCAGIFLLRGIV